MFRRQYRGLRKPTAAISTSAVKAGSVIWLAALALGAMPRAASAQLSVTEPEIFLKSNIRARRMAVVRVANASDQPADALLELQDWHRDESGTSTFVPPGTVTGSCRDQLTVSPSTVRIEPHSTEPVLITFDGAKDKGCWGIILVQSDAGVPVPNQGAATDAAMPGVKVFVEPEWLTRAAIVETLGIGRMRVMERDTARVHAAEILLRNTGDAHLNPTGAVEIRNADDLVVATVEIPEFPIAPGDARRMHVALPVLPRGRYAARVLFDYAGPDIAELDTQFELR